MSMCEFQPNCPVCNHYTYIYNRPIYCSVCSTYSTYKELDEFAVAKLPPAKKTSRPSVRPPAKRIKTMTDDDKTLLKSWANIQ